MLQEILHRYTSIGRSEAIDPTLQALLAITDEVFTIEKADVMRAAEIVQGRGSFSARDSLHLAVMERRGVRSILSFDADYDRWAGLHRIGSL